MSEAKEIYDKLIERNLAVLELLSNLNRAMEPDSGRQEVAADEETRQELLLCLDGIEDELRLTDGLRDLRQAARVPISPRPEY